MVNMVFLAALLVLSSAAGGGCHQMQLQPESLAVLRGSEVRLTCSTSDPWSVMSWLLNGAVLLTVSSQHGALPSGDPNATAEDHSAAAAAPWTSSWVLVLSAAERRHQGHVTCDLQGERRRTASLFVQDKGGVDIAGGNRTALQGRWVTFRCTAAGWFPGPRVGWRVGGVEVPAGEYNVSSAGPAGGPVTVTSDLGLSAARSSLVECLASVAALDRPLSSHVRLTVVAEVTQHQDQDGCSLLLTLTAVFATLLLLLLLLALCSISVVLYGRRRRRTKSNTRGALRFSQSVSGRTPVAEAAAAGKVNLGYSAEGLPDVFARGSRGQTGSVSVLEVPDVVSSRSRSPQGRGQAQTGPREPGPREPGPREAGPREPGPREPGPREPGPGEAGHKEVRRVTTV